MGIQYKAFPLVMDADDFQRTDRQIKWGIKFHEVSGMGAQTVHLVYTPVGGPQKNEVLDDQFDLRIHRDYGGDVTRWLKEFILPKINAWLAKTFPALDTGFVPDIPESKIEEAFALVKLLKITVAADGTLKASL